MRAAWALSATLAFSAGAARAAGPLDAPADERVVLHTSVGDLTFVLYPNAAPKHVEQVLRLVKLGVYDGTRFYQVDPDYIAQVASAQDRLVPLTMPQAAAIHPLKAEISALRHVRRSLSMARADDDPDSGETSFCILMADAPWLDGKYTIFGRVEGSEAVLQALAAVKTNANREPFRRVGVLKAETALAADLANIVSPIAFPQVDPGGPASRLPAAARWLVAFTLMLNTAALWAIRRRPVRVAWAFGLLGVLAGLFTFLVLIFPVASGHPLFAVGAFFTFVGLFRLLSGFEPPAATP